MRRSTMALVLLTVVSACTDTPVRPALDRVSAGDAAGSPAPFAFLPPLAPSPTPTGPFNPRLAPVVEICRLSAGDCVELVARISLVLGDYPIRVNELAEAYETKWVTPSAGSYRIQVLTANSDEATSTLFGALDVTKSAGDALSIRFRIEEGALCDPASCFEGKIDEGGGTLTLEDSTVGVTFPPGSLPAGQGPVNVIFERFPGGDPCLPTNQPQYEGCYHFRTEPVVELTGEAIVGVCLDEAALPYLPELELWKWDEEDPATLVALPRRTVDFLACDAAFASTTTPLGRFFAGVTWPVRALLTPDPLYAASRVPVPFGGGLNDFSRIGWVRPLQIAIVDGDGQVALPGTTLNTSPSVRISSARTQAVAPGVPVVFTPGDGSGSASPVTVLTDAYGIARTDWTLGSTAGPNSLRADAPNPVPSWPGRPGVYATVSFSATSVALSAPFLKPLGTLSSGPADWKSDKTPVLEICRLNGAICVHHVATLTDFEVEPGKRAYRMDWTVPASLPSGYHYRFRVMVAGVPIGNMITLARSSNATGTVPEPSFRVGRSLLIRFSIH